MFRGFSFWFIHLARPNLPTLKEGQDIRVVVTFTSKNEVVTLEHKYINVFFDLPFQIPELKMYKNTSEKDSGETGISLL